MAADVEATTQSAPERILDAACDLIAAEGIDEVRIARVAQRAGASTALVHHYFSTREELLEQALIHSFEEAGDERFRESPDSEETATDALARGLAESLPFPGSQEREWVLWVELWLRAVREPELRATSAKVYRQLHRALRELLEEGVADGEFAVADPGAAAERILAAIDGYGLRALLADPTVTPEHALARVWEQAEAELG